MSVCLSINQLGQLHKGDVARWCDSVWNLIPFCHIEAMMRCLILGWTKSDVIDGLGVKTTAEDMCWCGTHLDPACLVLL